MLCEFKVLGLTALMIFSYCKFDTQREMILVVEAGWWGYGIYIYIYIYIYILKTT